MASQPVSGGYTLGVAYVDIGDAELWVEDSGGEGPPLVLMHAAAGNSACWVEQRPLFEASGYRVIAYDLRGFGETKTAPGQDAASSMAADLESLVAALALPPFSLVATAFGGFGAIEFAIDNPAKLKALVISTSFGGLTDPEFAEFRGRQVRPDLASLPTVEKELGASYRAANPEGVRRFEAMEHGSYRGDGRRQTLRTPTTLARMGRIAVPTLVIAGDEDLYAPPPVMQLFAGRIPGSEFSVIEGAGHSAYWERPEEWNRTVKSFLNQHG